MTNLASLRPRSKGDWLMRLASVRRMPLGRVSQCHSGPVSGSTFVSALLRASLRERCAMTEQEIEHVAKAIYLVRVAPRRFPRIGRVACSGSSQLRKGCYRRDHGARRIEGDMNALAHASGSLVCEVSSFLGLALPRATKMRLGLASVTLALAGHGQRYSLLCASVGLSLSDIQTRTYRW